MGRRSPKKKKLRLPYGYAADVIKEIDNQGIIINKQFIYDCVNGRKKDSELTVKVWIAIMKVVTKKKKLTAKVAAVKNID